ncbi:hypothetical protein B566_EDAN008849 [Ephemera danica]|nr:hypothetical protein B566_EDAN008849 [Ephemera danica]
MSKSATDTGRQARNPTPVFFSKEVQQLLKALTSIDMQKVFQQKREQKRLQAPNYQFMTSEEVEKAIADAQARAEERLQMPPVMIPREPIECFMARDPALQGYTSSKFVFTDITYGKSDRERHIIVQDPDGTLRKASWEERERMNQSYFPMPGRSWKVPQMFEFEYLEPILAEGKYEFILDRACLQFEPDNPLYISITNKTYEHIDENRAYDSLRSTRHFGPLAFYLAWNCRVDNLILECLQSDRLEDAARTIQLLHFIHPSLRPSAANQDPMQLVKAYAESSTKRSSIELALQSCEEKRNERHKLAETLQEAHGHH